MQTSQGSWETPPKTFTKDARQAYEVNNGFIASIPLENNNYDKPAKHDEMALKTTVVSVLGNGTLTGSNSKPRRSKHAWCTKVLGIVAFLLLVAVLALLLLYVLEVNDSESPAAVDNKICMDDNCIQRSAGKAYHYIYLCNYILV